MNAQTRPNVIWILGDQHREQALGCSGDPNVHTPNIDQLAATGSQLSGISGYPLCCPFRGSMLTGVYPHKCVPAHEHPLPDGMPTIATVMNEAGYRTAFSSQRAGHSANPAGGVPNVGGLLCDDRESGLECRAHSRRLARNRSR